MCEGVSWKLGDSRGGYAPGPVRFSMLPRQEEGEEKETRTEQLALSPSGHDSHPEYRGTWCRWCRLIWYNEMLEYKSN
jgi:hypothetical protein